MTSTLIKEMTAENRNYLRDESRLVGHAEYISFPKDELELVQIMKECHDKAIKVNPQGALTGLAGGASPHGGLILNLSRMNRILGMRYDSITEEYFMRVQPGVLLTQVRKALQTKNFLIKDWDEDSVAALANIKPGQLFFAPDPTEPSASIGGMAACNASGSRSLLYGPMRDHVNQINVVFADGRVATLSRGIEKAEGRQISIRMHDGTTFEGELPDFETPRTKDAGYCFHRDMDLIDLFMGSQGTLGIISELEIRLITAPKHMWGVTAFLPNDYAAIDYVRILRGEKLEGKPTFSFKPAAIEFFDKMTLNMVLKQKEITPAFAQLQEFPEEFECAIYCEFNDQDDQNVIPTLKEIVTILEALGGDAASTWIADCDRQLQKLIFLRHAVPETVNLVVDKHKAKDSSITILSADMAVPDEYIVDVYDMYRSDLENRTNEWIIFGHIGETHYHPDIFPHNKEEYEAGLKIFEEWAEKVRNWGGTITAEHGAGKLKVKLAEILYGKENLPKIREFKKSLDDKYILGPGNIIGD